MMSMESQSEKSLLSEFRESLKLNIQEHQKYGVAAKYDEYLNEPEFEEHPRMQELDVERFYEGKLHRSSEYQPGVKPITMDTIFGVSEKESGRKLDRTNHATILAQAGAGKSTILSRFARDAMDGKIPQMVDEDHMVHIVNCRLFGGNEHIDVPTFLFENMTHRTSDEAIKVGYKWMLNQPDKVTLIIDSLDTLPFHLGNNSMIIGPHASASPGTILYNILTGNILSKCRILSSSREHAVRDYKGDLRADRLIALTGLTQESIERLIYGFLGEEKGEKVLQHFKTKCPLIMMLSENPAFLVFSLIASSGLEKSENAFIPKSLSGVMINLLVSLLHSEHQTALGLSSEIEMISIINKLKSLSFKGMMNGKVLFREEDFTQVGLDTEKVTDLVIVIPGLSHKTHRLFEGESVFYFSHQIIEETFASLFIAEMDSDEFKSFVEKHLQKPELAMVRRMLVGILLHPEVHQEAAKHQLLQVGTDVSSKINLVQDHLRNQFQSALEKHELLEWVHAVTESGSAAENLVPKKVKYIILENTPLMVSDMYALAFVLSHCDSVDSIIMCICSLSSQSLQVFAEGLKTKSPKLTKLNICVNGPFNNEGSSALGELVKKSQIKELVAGDCRMTEENLKSLAASLAESKLKKLCIGDVDIRTHPPCPVHGIRDLIPNVTEELNICQYDLNESERSLLQAKLNRHYPEAPVIKYGNLLHIKILRAWSRHFAHFFLLSPSGNYYLSKNTREKKESKGPIPLASTGTRRLITALEFPSTPSTTQLTQSPPVRKVSTEESWVEMEQNTEQRSTTSSETRTIIAASESTSTIPSTSRGTTGDDVIMDVTMEELKGDENSSHSNDSTMVIGSIALESSYKKTESKAQEDDAEKSRGLGYQTEVQKDLGSRKEFIQIKDETCQEREKNTEKNVSDDHRLTMSHSSPIHDVTTTKKDEPLLSLDKIGNKVEPEVAEELQESPDDDSGGKELSSGGGDLNIPIVVSKSLTTQIGSEGGEVKISDCIISFPKGAFDDVTKVEAKLEIDSSKWPKGYIGITPMLYVSAENELQCPAKVRISSWCKNNGSEKSKNMKVHVLHLPDGSSEWEVINTLPLLNDTEFKFECTDFSPVIVATEENDISASVLLIKSYLLATSDGNFTFVSLLKAKMLHDEVRELKESIKYELDKEFNPIISHCNDQFTARIECYKPQDVKFEAEFKFQLDEDFINVKKHIIFHDVMDHGEEGVFKTYLRYHMLKNQVIVDGNHRFKFNFNNKQQELEPNQNNDRSRAANINIHKSSRVTINQDGVTNTIDSSLRDQPQAGCDNTHPSQKFESIQAKEFAAHIGVQYNLYGNLPSSSKVEKKDASKGRDSNLIKESRSYYKKTHGIEGGSKLDAVTTSAELLQKQTSGMLKYEMEQESVESHIEPEPVKVQDGDK